MVRSVAGLPVEEIPRAFSQLGEASATQQLLALLAAGVGRPDVVHADEAEADSENEDGDIPVLCIYPCKQDLFCSTSSCAPVPQDSLFPVSSQGLTSSASRLATLHSDTVLPPELLEQADTHLPACPYVRLPARLPSRAHAHMIARTYARTQTYAAG